MGTIDRLVPRRRRCLLHREGTAMKTLVIDNDGPFTYNLVHLFAEVTGNCRAIVFNDEMTWRLRGCAGRCEVARQSSTFYARHSPAAR